MTRSHQRPNGCSPQDYVNSPKAKPNPPEQKKHNQMKKLLLTITMLAMALTAQASPILLTSDGSAAAAVAGGIGILGLTWLAFFIIGVVWLIFPFVVWVKLNRIIQNTRTAADNLYALCNVARQEFEKPPIPR